MGQEIDQSHFRKADFAAFEARLRGESALLEQWFEEQRFADDRLTGGFELEAWLVDRNLDPLPANELFLERLADPLVVPELARFNVEINAAPQPLEGGALGRMQTELESTWGRCRATAAALDGDLLMAGILPTLEDHHLVPANMSSLQRYRALNEQVLRQRRGRPLQLDIIGRERLTSRHMDVMLEAAATSFQVHIQVPPRLAVRYYNAAILLSAPMVAISANSPLLFGKALWEETRIPLFEQAVEIGGFRHAAAGPLRRVSFGSGYAQQSLVEPFRENLAHFPILLPKSLDQPPERLPHVQLHNGTIWRWNRPLIGFDAAGRPHLRVEHRVMPGGPTIVDAIANAALLFGLAHALATRDTPPELALPFPTARENFYAAARYGLEAQVTWLEGRKVQLRGLLHKQLLPMARRGLEALELRREEIDDYLAVVEARSARHRTGSDWQRRNHRWSLRELTAAYAQRQHGGGPVHDWSDV